MLAPAALRHSATVDALWAFGRPKLAFPRWVRPVASKAALAAALPASVRSMILWGPPGVGKTTLAELLARASEAHLEHLSAVMAGVKEIRAVVERARQRSSHASLFR